MAGLDSYYNALYKDTITVRRYVSVTNDNNQTSIVLSETPIYANIPCYISLKRIDVGKEQGNQNELITVVKIFYGLAYIIKAGDFIDANKIVNGNTMQTYKGTSGKHSSSILGQSFELQEGVDA